MAALMTAQAATVVSKVAAKSFSGNTRVLAARPAAPKASRTVVQVQARDLWIKDGAAPAHLDGSIPGDFGFDPLGLGTDPDRLKWYQEAEAVNGRWAMLATAGILFAEGTGAGNWIDAPNTYGDLFTFPGFNGSVLQLFAFQSVVVGFIEIKRLEGFVETGSSGFLDSYPFDPLGMDSPEMRKKEVKNGRLAMISFVGYLVQGLVTGNGPIADLNNHMAAPFDNYIWTNIGTVNL
eukprot:CAMPEP_0182912778 /NCGR_PEP_ID=MMETSP0034_2-20130328/37696_1 /TAXON_ID=156128 /ORGANISM="Nephroselmis pyriformis, Strain CCMP717" /LENGTH=234 /DNA_ID=CAMNT_0025049471 /DNA_START=21 /DNA_END=725 /DNA_ORIENTATION=+